MDIESVPSTTTTSLSALAVADRTEQCLAEMEDQYRQTGKRASVVLIFGRTGVGKSSIFEDLTDSHGHSQHSIDSATREFAIDKAFIGNEEYFIMDTPGFDPGNEQRTFLEIARGIDAIRTFTRVSGILYLTCINQPRFDDFDRKLVRLILALCGDTYVPHLTFVTTFWTAASKGQQDRFICQLRSLRRSWQDESAYQQLNLYQHGRAYTAGEDTGDFLDWFDSRPQIAQHAKDMIARRYGGQTRLRNRIPAPRIVQELTVDTPIHDTEAGKLLMMSPTGSSSAWPVESNRSPETEPTLQRNDSIDDSPPPDRERRPREARTGRAVDPQHEPEPCEPAWVSWIPVVRDGIVWLMKNVDFNLIGGGPRSGGLRVAMGNAYNGQLDPNSSVDVMKSFGLDSSRNGRLLYAQAHGIPGDPFSASWGDAIREDVIKRYR